MATATTTKTAKAASAKATVNQGKTPSKKAPKAAKTAGEAAPSGSFAVIATGGKQYLVHEGDSVKIEKMKGEYKVGDSVTFSEILLLNDKIGAPTVAGAKVTGSIVEIARHPKVTVIKYKQKSRYFKKNGHKQPYFKVKIERIG